MKLLRKTTLLLLGGAVLFSTSCKKWVEDINVSPNNATDAPLSAVMTATFVGLITPNEGEDARLGCLWAQQFTGTDRQYSAFDNYLITSESFDWAGPYFSVIQQANICIVKAKAEGNKFYEGVSLLLNAHAFGMTTAGWGDIPFSQANDIVNYPSPKYDPQRDVYLGVQIMLDNAIAALTDGTGGDAYGVDFYFGGDAAKWIAVAHTLKARFYLHTGDLNMAGQHAMNGVMASADNWMVPHGGAYNQDLNTYNSFGEFDRQGYMTAPGAYLPEILNPDAAKQNPSFTGKRRNHAKTDETERFAWVYAGDTSDMYDLNYSGMWTGSSPFPLVTALETKLIIAEVELLNSGTANGLTALNDVRTELTALFPTGTYLAFAETDFNAGGIEDNGKADVKNNMLFEIYEEKYTSLVGQLEVFNDLRRTKNFMGLTPKGNDNKFPQRFLTPQAELDGNLNAPSPPDLFSPTEVNK